MTQHTFCSPSRARRGVRAVIAVAFAAARGAPVWAAEPALIAGPSINITTTDMRADALRMPEEMRFQVLSKPQTVMQIASSLYARRAMAQKAAAEGIDKDPLVAAALQVARDKVLSDAFIEKMDKATAPTDAAAESMARSIYRAKPERFRSEEQVQIRHILIAGKTPESRTQADKLLEELKAGADFAATAKSKSADPGSAAKGGELGTFAKGKMLPEFDTAAFALQKPGDLSEVVETKFGFHVLQLQNRLPAGQRTFEEVREELVKEVRNNVIQEARASEAQKLQQEAKINTEAIEAFAAGHTKPAR